jgi:hypothetical protein
VEQQAIFGRQQMKSLRGKPRSIMFLGFKSLLSQQAAGNSTRERLKMVLDSLRSFYYIKPFFRAILLDI